MTRQLKLLLAFVLLCATAFAAPHPPVISVAQSRDLKIPRIDRVPTLEDFIDMRPDARMHNLMLHISDFTQRSPYDGRPATQATEAYLGYDSKNLYAVFVCFDSDPKLVRAHMARREDIWSDDIVQMTLDTFHDQRRAYVFAANPFGVQWDATYTEANGSDSSFDTVWQSRGRRTPQGYVVLMSIPFRSLRFSPVADQGWGIVINRYIPRLNEDSYWPRVTATLPGRLNQEATASGLEGISPGRNIQLNPYTLARGSRSLDSRNAAQPVFDKGFAAAAGMDAKMVIKDSLVLDATVHPDFSQVEADAPQVTVNQRFPVYFPEKRPFFLENASYFQTPFNLVFTRNIVSPQAGLRLTGKQGDFSVGALLADDTSPGDIVLPSDPEYGKSARFGVLRVNRDFGGQSSVGAIYTDREFDGSYNRVGGLDAKIKFTPHWDSSFQAVTSETRHVDGSTSAGPAYQANTSFGNRSFGIGASYYDTGADFETDLGFINRSDDRSVNGWSWVRFHPEDSALLSWGPSVSTWHDWDHTGLMLDQGLSSSVNWKLKGQTSFGVSYNTTSEQLRPQDYSALSADELYDGQYDTGFWTDFSHFENFTFGGSYSWQQRTNYVPAVGAPYAGTGNRGHLYFTLRPSGNIRIDNSYILDMMHVDDPTSLRASGIAASQGDSIFNDHILQSKLNWQFNRELSVRVIAQYNSVIANPSLSSLLPARGFNADFLISYMVHPGTAFYVGYNSDLQNYDPHLRTDANSNILRNGDAFLNDGRQFFVKISYLFRL